MKKVIVLPGGGADGYFQVGVLKRADELGKLGPSIDLICGTSVGGLIGLKLAMDNGETDGICALFASIKENKDIYKGMLQFSSIWDDIGMASQIMKDNKGVSVLDALPLHKLIDETFGDMRMGELPIHCIITVVNLSKGIRAVFDSTVDKDVLVAEVAKATAAIEGIFQGIVIKGDLYGDGGALRNNPVCYAIEAGATDILLIGTSADEYPRKEVPNKLLQVIMRLLEAEMHDNEEASWDELVDYNKRRELDPTLPEVKCTDIYPPNGTPSDALNFKNKKWLFEAGYKKAVEVLG